EALRRSPVDDLHPASDPDEGPPLVGSAPAGPLHGVSAVGVVVLRDVEALAALCADDLVGGVGVGRRCHQRRGGERQPGQDDDFSVHGFPFHGRRPATSLASAVPAWRYLSSVRVRPSVPSRSEPASPTLKTRPSFWKITPLSLVIA